MSRAFSDFPNELLLAIGRYLEPRDLHSFVRVSRHFSTLFLSHLRGLALRKENTHAAIYWALASRNRTMLKRVLEEGENVIILINSSKVVHRSPKKCSEWILALYRYLLSCLSRAVLQSLTDRCFSLRCSLRIRVIYEGTGAVCGMRDTANTYSMEESKG